MDSCLLLHIKLIFFDQDNFKLTVTEKEGFGMRTMRMRIFNIIRKKGKQKENKEQKKSNFITIINKEPFMFKFASFLSPHRHLTFPHRHSLAHRRPSPSLQAPY